MSLIPFGPGSLQLLDCLANETKPLNYNTINYNLLYLWREGLIEESGRGTLPKGKIGQRLIPWVGAVLLPQAQLCRQRIQCTFLDAVENLDQDHCSRSEFLTLSEGCAERAPHGDPPVSGILGWHHQYLVRKLLIAFCILASKWWTYFP